MGKCYVSALAQHYVYVQLDGHALVKLQASIVEADPGWRQVVAPYNGSVAPAAARAYIAFF